MTITLDADQEKVAEHTLGPSLVSGAPGSGKSRSVVVRVIRLVQRGVRPEHILVLTFTRAACGEIHERLLLAGVNGVEVRTFHSLCFNRLRVLWKSGMAQVRFDERHALPYQLKRVARDLKKKGIIHATDVLDLQILETFISRCKNMGAVPVHGNPFGLDQAMGQQNVLRVAETWLQQRTGLPPQDGLRLFQEYEDRRWEMSLFDFDDGQNWLFQALAGSEAIRRWWASQWSVVIVDEAMDSSAVQHSLSYLSVGLLDPLSRAKEIERDHNLMIVADLAQSLFSWRCAVPEEIAKFIETCKPAVYTLPNNYRSTDTICDAASRIIEGKKWNLTGRIKPTRLVVGVPIEMLTFTDRREEMAFALATARAEGPGRVATLARSSGILHWLAIMCTREGIPFRRLMSGSIFDSRETRDLLNYLRAASSESDPEGAALRAIINVPFRYIGARNFQLVATRPRAGGRALIDDLLNHGDLKYPQRRAMVRLKKTLEHLAEEAGTCPGPLLAWLVKDINYEDHLAEEMGLSTASGDEGASIVLEELVTFAADFHDVPEMLLHIEQLRGVQQRETTAGRLFSGEPPLMTLATVHSMKGLQSPVVILADVVFGRFPSGNVRGDPELGQEELRILYVAVSRAQDRLIVTRTKRGATQRDSSFWTLLSKIAKSQNV